MGDAVTFLPRGGVYVATAAGAVQFGVPPETIKDSMALGLPVPAVYVVPREPFDRRRGINTAECEFPAYYNFFVLGRRIRLVVPDATLELRIRTVFQESLFGPSAPVGGGEFAEEYPHDQRPDFTREGDVFRRDATGARLSLDALVEFVRLDERGAASLGAGVQVVLDTDGHYVVFEGEHVLARVPAGIELPPRRPLGEPPPRPFEPPAFGVTVLGSSHGFDPKGKTTGFIVWVGHRGLLVDPPVDATDILREQGVPSKLIDGVILTHCHADHDSGTFQKLLEEGRVNLYTTPTVLNSFLKKYSALSGIGEDLLRRTFVFTPFTVGAPTRVHGAEIWCFYNLHSIPALGFEVFFGGKSLVISGDAMWDPERLRALAAQGVLSPGRCEDLLDFPWHHTVVLHEAGVPPIHTPVAVLAALPDEVKSRLHVVHIAEKDMPAGVGLSVARVGLEHTLRIEVVPAPRAEAIELLDAICSVDLFRDFTLERAREILHVAKVVRARAGDKVIAQGAAGDMFYVVQSGVLAVHREGRTVKTYQAGDYFGETALVLGQARNADVVATTEVTLVAIGRYDFLYLLRGTDILDRLVRLARMRTERAWEVLERNVLLRSMSSSQKTQLLSYLEARTVGAGDVLWRTGGSCTAAYLVDEGAVAIEGGRSELAPFGAGSFVGDFESIRQRVPAGSTGRVAAAGRVFQIGRDDLSRFLQDNPGVLVSFLNTSFVE